MTRYGIFAQNVGRQVSRIFPTSSQWDDLLVIRPADLPNGTGRPYAVMVQGYVGQFSSSDPNIRTVTRYGFLFQAAGGARTEIAHTWTHIARHSTAMHQGPRFGMPFQICVWIPSWPAGATLIFAAHQVPITVTVGRADAVFDGLVAIVLDAQAFGGSATSTGWSGTKLVVKERRNTILNLSSSRATPVDIGNLPWSSGTQQWFVAWSERLMLKDTVDGIQRKVPTALTGVSVGVDKSIVKYRPKNLADTGLPGLRDSHHIYSVGHWTVLSVANATTWFRTDAFADSTLGVADPSFAFDGTVIAFRVDNLDGFAHQKEAGLTAQGFGISSGPYVERDYSSTTPENRDLPSVVSMGSIETRWNGVSGAPALGVDALQQGRWFFARFPTLKLFAHLELAQREQYAVGTALVTGYPMIDAMTAHYGWHESPEVPVSTQQAPGFDRQYVTFSLTDDGPIATPGEPVYTVVQIHPGYEAPALGAMHEFLHPPQFALPIETPNWTQLRAADGSLFCWGAHTTADRVYSLRWVLSRADALALLLDLQSKRSFRWTPTGDIGQAEIAVYVSNPTLTSGTIGEVTATGVELRYFAP